MFKTEQEKKEYIQRVIDRLQYCPAFKTELDCMMLKYDIPKNVKLSHNVSNFNYSKV